MWRIDHMETIIITNRNDDGSYTHTVSVAGRKSDPDSSTPSEVQGVDISNLGEPTVVIPAALTTAALAKLKARERIS